MTVAAILLAAGGGRRLAGSPDLLAPKGLTLDATDTPWVTLMVRALRAGGCDPVVVVTGAAADEVAAAAGPGVTVVHNADWTTGLGGSLRTGLEAAEGTDADAALVALVDMPQLTSAVVARLVDGATTNSLARASYDGVPGHPVLLGRSHWAAARAEAGGDQGARRLTAAATLVECGDLGDGRDIDTAADLPAGHRVTHRAAPPTRGPGAAGAG